MDITEKLEQTYNLIRSRGFGVHPAWVREGVQEIVALREKVRILEHEKREVKVPSLEEALSQGDLETFSHSEEKGLDGPNLSPEEQNELENNI